MKKAINIVLSKSLDGNDRKACIFYSDGSIENVSFKDTIAMLNEMEKNKTIFNESKIFVMTEAELNRRFDDFVVEVPKPKTIEEAIEAAFNSLSEESFLEIQKDGSEYITLSDNVESDNKTLVNTKLEEIAPVVDESKNINADEFSDVESLEDATKENDTNSEELTVDTIVEKDAEEEDLTSIFKIKNSLTSDQVLSKKTIIKEVEDNNEVEVVENKSKATVEDIEEFLNENLPDGERPAPEEITEKRGKLLSLIRRKFDPYNKTSHRVGAVALTALMFSTVASCAKPDTNLKPDTTGAEIVSPPSINERVDDKDDKNKSDLKNDSKDEEKDSTEVKKYDDNIYYKNYTFDQLLEVTTNPAQKKAMKNIGDALEWYNGPFADQFVEEDKDIRTALTWDEMVALQMAYNDYSKYDLHAIFNGSEVDSNQLTNAYKNATLQLICAYILEDEDSLLDVSKFIHDEESIAFVQKYQNLLEAVKNSSGEERTQNEKAFVNELETDFPITDEERVEGISHADIDITESKKLAIAPIVQAFELIERNGFSLDSKQFNYFDTLGLCNLAEAKFDKIETITLACCEVDKTNPTYEQFKEAKIKILIEKNIYVIDDKHRDVSQYDKFKERVDGNYELTDEGFLEIKVWYETNTYTVVKKWKVTTTKKKHKTEKIETDDRDKAVKEAGEDKVKKAEDRVDKETEEENKKLKEEGEEQAKETQEERQKEEDQKKEELEEEVKKDDEDLQEDIKDANDKINENNKDEDTTNDTPVNESDFDDHDVQFDPDDSNDNGDLNDSVKDTTTDGNESHDYNDLPDPNETGAAFDEAYEEEEVVENESSHEESAPAPKEEPAPAPKEEPAPAPKEEPAPAPKQETSNEKAVNDYVEKQASEPQEDEEDKVLVKE